MFADAQRPFAGTWNCRLPITFIGGVSLYDAFLILAHPESICQLEENPIGRLLISLGEGDVTLFFVAKLGGTTAALLLLIRLWMFNSTIAQSVTNGLVGFQGWLLWYLTCFTRQVEDSPLPLAVSISIATMALACTVWPLLHRPTNLLHSR